jgi:hypothetical protein
VSASSGAPADGAERETDGRRARLDASGVTATSPSPSDCDSASRLPSPLCPRSWGPGRANLGPVELSSARWASASAGPSEASPGSSSARILRSEAAQPSSFALMGLSESHTSPPRKKPRRSRWHVEIWKGGRLARLVAPTRTRRINRSSRTTPEMLCLRAYPSRSVARHVRMPQVRCSIAR